MVWRIGLFLVLIGMSLGAASQTCYQLLDSQGRAIYESKKPPYSLAYPPTDDPKREASRLRGEQLVILRDRNCGLGRPNWPSPSVQPAKPARAPPAAFGSPSVSPAGPPAVGQRGTEPTVGRTGRQREPNRVEPTPKERFQLIFKYPWDFFLIFVESIPAALLAYALVWGGFRVRRGSAYKIGLLGHLGGIIFTLLGSAAIRTFAYLTFAGWSAYRPSMETAEAGVYLLFIPVVVATLYLGSASAAESDEPDEGAYADDVSTSTVSDPRDQPLEGVTNGRKVMNERQRTILVVVGVIIALMLFFPPYTVVAGSPGRVIESGYTLILNLPRGATVDIGMLLVQWLGVVVVGVIALFLSKNRSSV